jgi:hypothetical protein
LTWELGAMRSINLQIILLQEIQKTTTMNNELTWEHRSVGGCDLARMI